MRTRLKANPVPIQMPIGAEEKFEGVIDLVRMKAIYWDEHPGHEVRVREIPADLQDECRGMAREDGRSRRRSERRTDEQVPRRATSTEARSSGLRTRTIANEIVPMLCGSAFKNKGVQAMLDAVIDYLPSPVDIPPVKGDDWKTASTVSAKPNDDEPFSALAFKIMTDPFVGQLTFFRVYSGVLNSGDTIYNPIKGTQRAYRPYPADARQPARRNQGSATPATSPRQWA